MIPDIFLSEPPRPRPAADVYDRLHEDGRLRWLGPALALLVSGGMWAGGILLARWLLR